MSDIVEDLRAYDLEACRAAADEIERLRARVEEVEYWNGAVAVCEDHVQDIVALDPKACVICDEERLRAENEMLRSFRDMVHKEVGRVASLMEIPKP